MKQLLLFIIILIAVCAEAQVNGMVTDAEGKTIPYATIWIDGEERGMSADEHGKFTIAASDADKTLVFYMLGYAEKRLQQRRRRK